MKIKYKDFVGELTPEKYSESCTHCCFRQDRDCIPYSVWQCFVPYLKNRKVKFWNYENSTKQ